MDSSAYLKALEQSPMLAFKNWMCWAGIGLIEFGGDYLKSITQRQGMLPLNYLTHGLVEDVKYEYFWAIKNPTLATAALT
jgi:hypothetical protein